MNEIKKVMKYCEIYKNKNIIIIFALLIVSAVINVFLPIISSNIVDNGLAIYSVKFTIIYSVVYTLLFFLKIIVDYIKEKKRIDVYIMVKENMFSNICKHLIKIKYEYLDKKKAIEIYTDIQKDLENMSSIFDNETFFGIMQILNFIGGIIGLAYINFRMTIVILLFIPVKMVIVRNFSKKNKKSTESYIKDIEKMASLFQDFINGQKIERIFNAEKVVLDKLGNKQKEVLTDEKKLNILPQKNAAINNIIAQIIVLFVYIFGIVELVAYKTTLGKIFAFVTYSSYVIGPISVILNIKYKLYGIIPSAKRICDFMELEEENINGADITQIKGDICLENVDFSYDKNLMVLNKMNLLIKKKQKNVIVGINGVGKTSVLNVILRFYSPQAGRVLLDNKDVNKYNLREYRNLFSVIDQSFFLFDDSIRNNITVYGEFSDEEIYEACRKSNILDFVNRVSLEYIVGANGVRLSGGQRQKIALARVFLYDRPIIVMDEMTSNVDAESIKLIKEKLECMYDKTIIVCTHDREIMDLAENIIYL